MKIKRILNNKKVIVFRFNSNNLDIIKYILNIKNNNSTYPNIY